MSARFMHSMPFGAEIEMDTVRFRLWAPDQDTVGLVVEDGAISEFVMERHERGWFEFSVPIERAGAGSLYRFRLADGLEVPDPASRFQPHDVHGPSQVIDPQAYLWRNDSWQGRPWEEAVLYELHTGCFSEAGTFDGIRNRLDYLADLGVTAIEIMPVSDFEGRHNWGYDGTLPFAPDSAYGSPNTLKRLVDEAHDHELMVFLDVVYNHFGPSGNYLHRYASRFFTQRHRTPWGAAINFDDRDSDIVRSFFIDNALYWLQEFRFDGLRFDAVHAIRDDHNPHILEELAGEVRARIDPARYAHLILENDDNAARFLRRGSSRRVLFYDAQWNDDFHHAAHVIMTGEKRGYYSDYETQPERLFARVLAEGFAYQGERSAYRGDLPRGEPSADLPPTAFVSFLQNHDQIGNRAFGDRLATLANPQALRAFHAILLLSPEIPLLFMGEEWGCRVPFLFFCDFDKELAGAVRNGRREEFSRFSEFIDPKARERIPDPNAIDTFLASKLDWSESGTSSGKGQLAFIKELVALRRRAIAPLLAGASSGNTKVDVRGPALKIDWPLGPGRRLYLAANLSPTVAEGLDWILPGAVLYSIPETLPGTSRIDSLAPWSILFTLENRANAG